MSTPKNGTPYISTTVATIVLKSKHFLVLKDIVGSGMIVMQMDFSHATIKEVEMHIKNLCLSKGRHNIVHSDKATEAFVGELLVHN